MDTQPAPAGSSVQTVAPNPETPLASRWFWYLVAVAGVIVVVITVVRLLFPVAPPQVVPSDTVLPNVDGTQSSFNNLRFVGAIPEFPKQLPIAKLTQELGSVERRLVEFFELDEDVDQVGVWRNNRYVMEFNAQKKQFEVRLLEPAALQPNPKKGFSQSPQQLSSAALASLFPDQNFQLINDDELTFFSGAGSHYQVTEADQALLFHGSASYELEGIPIFIGNDFRPPVVFDLNPNQEFELLRITSALLQFQTQPATKLLTIEEALQQLLNTQAGTIIESYVETNTPVIDVSTIQSGELNTVELEYRLNTTTNLIVPYYKFGGRVTNAQGYDYNVTLITPAVRLGL